MLRDELRAILRSRTGRFRLGFHVHQDGSSTRSLVHEWLPG